MTREEQSRFVYDHGMCLWDDEEKADALRDMVMGSLDEDATDAYFWDLLHECAQNLDMP